MRIAKIEQVDNGYILKTESILVQTEIYTDFQDLVKRLCFFFDTDNVVLGKEVVPENE